MSPPDHSPFRNDQREIQRAVHKMADAVTIGVARNNEMKRRSQPEAVETNQRGSGVMSTTGGRPQADELLADLLVSAEQDWRCVASMVDEKGSRAMSRSQSPGRRFCANRLPAPRCGARSELYGTPQTWVECGEGVEVEAAGLVSRAWRGGGVESTLGAPAASPFGRAPRRRPSR